VELENPGFEGTYNYVDVDEPPMFEECEGKVTDEEQENCFHKFLMTNISKNVKYPESAKELNVEGKVYVAFVVDKNGLISQTKVVRGSGYVYERTEEPINEYIDAYKDLDAAAVEAIKQTQKIKPAMVDNAPVSVQYTIPVSFKIE
jgi:protein TonB